MSASYGFIGDRWLRKYTAKADSPVYAAEAEVSYLSTHLCDVPWESAGSVRDARMTWHTEENVGTEESPISGLDANVKIRDQFDAALFCAGHHGGGHRVYANAAVYVYRLPDNAVGKTLESVSVRVTSDPYNSTGARISILTNTDGSIPRDCAICRNGGIWSGTAYTASDTFHTSPDASGKGVAPRIERTSTGGSVSWYPNTQTATLNPQSFVLQRYLMVFVVLENYNVVRGNWVEGSSFMENRISVTLNQAVTGWTAGDVIDLTSSGGAGFETSITSGGAILSEGSKVCMYETSRSGNAFPERPILFSGGEDPSLFAGHIISNASLVPRTWVSSSTDGRQGTILYSAVSSSMLRYNDGTTLRRRMYLMYHPSLAQTGFLPCLSFKLAKYQSSGSASTGLPTEEIQSQVTDTNVTTLESSGQNLPAYQMLSDGSATFVSCAFGGGPIYTRTGESGVKFQAAPVYVGGPSGTYVLGFLEYAYSYSGSYASSPNLINSYSFYFADATLGSLDLANGVSGAIGMYPGSFIGSDYTISVDSTTYVATVPQTGMETIVRKAKLMFAEQTDVGYILRYNGHQVQCVGSGFKFVPSNITNYGAHVSVSGRLESVGGKECSGLAYVMMLENGGSSLDEVVTDKEILAVHSFNGDIYGMASTKVDTATGSTTTNLVICGGFTTVDGVSGYNGWCLVNFDTLAVMFPPSYTLPTSEYVTSMASPKGTSSSAPMIMMTAKSALASKVYGPTSYDDDLMETGAAASTLGLRNCYANLFSGNAESVNAFRTVEGAAFVLSQGVRSMRISEDGGQTAQVVSFPVWRVMTSTYVVPTSTPSGFVAGKARIAFGTVASGIYSGARVNVWVFLGSRKDGLGDLVTDHRLYDATESDVGGWKLLGSVVPSSNASYDLNLEGAKVASEATFLFTAWIPQDAFNPSDGGSVPAGIGTLTSDGYGVITGLGGGLKPSVELLV